MSARLLAFPPSPRTAHRVACRLRSDGFYVMPQSMWGDVADLAEFLIDAEGTPQQLEYLRAVHRWHLLQGTTP